ncbi:low-density lipoprotein receptor-related protein 11 isoform X4 [Pimephales promelas]|uniref:low-density lipoprotein receptor-related protein 11 isoform X4 n=1 Tax=Pimephales promelas TaxID=90988 RepID=UPI0019555EBD|nr:low-density lipoprotein receptor-related protein 11 isoform X4 [Pimephales promelas]
MLRCALHHHVQRALICSLLLCVTRTVLMTRSSSPTSDLKSQISGVEELLEEFRKQLQQEPGPRGDAGDGDRCVRGFQAQEERIIRASASIEQGGAFLSAPPRVFSWRDCVHACCAHPHCTDAIIQEELTQPDGSLRCYLFNCTSGGRSVCSFSFQPGFSTYSRADNSTRAPSAAPGRPDTAAEGGPAYGIGEESLMQGVDEPPRSDAGQDLVVQLPTDWAVLDGRDSTDDHRITQYDWALVKGDPSVRMKVSHPGLLKLSGLREGIYTFEITVTDTAGQKSSDNVSVSVLAPAPNSQVCTGHCSRYQFMCDDGCCIDIGYACDGKQHCPDRSDEDFCQNFDTGHKSNPSSKHGPDIQNTEAGAQTASEIQLTDSPKPAQHQHYGFSDHAVTEHQATATPLPSRTIHTSAGASAREEEPHNSLPAAKTHRVLEGHPAPESGAILPLTLGLIISALLLLMAGCRVWLVGRRLKKALPLTTEESDYLINGMYL